MTASQYFGLKGVCKPNPNEKEVAEAERALRVLFKDTFRSREDRIVLAVILEDLGVFRQADDPEKAALKNYGTYFLTNRLGINLNLETLEALLAKAEE